MVRLLLAVATWLLGWPLSHPVHAACNAIPAAPDFRGAWGSIDRPFLSPDPDEEVTLRLAPQLDSERPAVASPETHSLAQGLVVTLRFKETPGAHAKTLGGEQPGPRTKTFYIASKEKCEELEEPACFIERLFCRSERTCFTPSAEGGEMRLGPGLQELRFRFPDVGRAGPVTIAVSTADQPPPSELRSQSCKDLVNAKRPGLRLCIDELLPPEEDPPADPKFSALVVLPASYDYRTVCTSSVDCPDCLGTSDEVSYTLNGEGDVLMPVRWSNILRQKDPIQFYQRNLLASTAVEAVSGQGKRIFVPSAAFLETTTQKGGGFAPNPSFIPLELPTTRPNEQVFSGTADQGKSVLKFARRKLWTYTCKGGPNQSEGCEPDWAGVDCPASQCVHSAAAYFACVGGTRHRLPCTRTAHCPGGSCRAIGSTNPNVCVLLDGTATETPCAQDSDCGVNADCGPGLFEFRNRTPNGIGKLKRIDAARRSVCANDESNVCAGAASASACSGSADCVTYRAAALTYTTPMPSPAVCPP